MTCSGLADSLRRAEIARAVRDAAKELNDEVRLELYLGIIEAQGGSKA